LFTSQRVPRSESNSHAAAPDNTPREFAAPVAPAPIGVTYPDAPPPLGGAFDELLIVQARRRARLTRVFTVLAVFTAAGTAGWLWYASLRSPIPHSRPSAGKPDQPAAVLIPSAPPPVVLPPATTVPVQQAAPTPAPQPAPTRDREQVAQPPAEHVAPASTATRPGMHGHGEHSAAPAHPPNDVGSAGNTTPGSGTAPSTPPASPTWQLTPSPAAQDDRLLPNPYRHD
jgi:hypothetical protein